jgi:hypothetical protein
MLVLATRFLIPSGFESLFNFFDGIVKYDGWVVIPVCIDIP